MRRRTYLIHFLYSFVLIGNDGIFCFRDILQSSNLVFEGTMLLVGRVSAQEMEERGFPGES